MQHTFELTETEIVIISECLTEALEDIEDEGLEPSDELLRLEHRFRRMP